MDESTQFTDEQFAAEPFADQKFADEKLATEQGHPVDALTISELDVAIRQAAKASRTDGEAEVLLSALLKASEIAVGCSGGPDSLSLTLLLKDWASSRGIKVTPLIVDHKLRPESAVEASACAAILKSRGLDPVILSDPESQRLPGSKTPSNLQAFARRLRYRLIQDWMRVHSVTNLFLAHHQEDQAETILLRMARGSGVAGLAAMRPVSSLFDPLGPSQRVWRPLLTTSKAMLNAVVTTQGVTAAQDPSNEDSRHARIRFRKLAPTLSWEGLGADRLATTAMAMARADDALRAVCEKWIADNVHLSPFGFAKLSLAFLSLSEELRLRVLSMLVRAVSGAEYPPRLKRVQNALRLVEARQSSRGLTMGGTKLVVTASNETLTLCREVAAVSPGGALITSAMIWDQRFVITAKGQGTDTENLKNSALEIRALGARGVSQARVLGYEAVLDPMPGAARAALPGVWRGADLVKLPEFMGQETPHLPENSGPMEIPLPIQARFFCWDRMKGEAV